MPYTEIKQKNKRNYFYRVRTLRNGKKFKKKRIYLGKNLSKKELSTKEKEADLKLKTPKKELKAIKKIAPKIRKVLKKYKIKKAGIFGSYARGENKKKSDVDILIEPPKGMGLEFVGVKLELEDELGKKVDLITYKYIHPFLKKKILESEVRII